MANLTLEGKWDLDYSNSDSPSDLLAAQGVGWATRKIISGLQILETLTITGSEVWQQEREWGRGRKRRDRARRVREQDGGWKYMIKEQ
tara:strand:+ start:979 stop:1242 length:264 start_codon:yes stop_codon:yes gene_type:complete